MTKTWFCDLTWAGLSVLVLPLGGSAGAQGSTYLVNRAADGEPANDYTGGASVSADGRVVAFHSGGNNLVAGDTNAVLDAFVHDRLTALTRRVSVSSTGTQANGETWDPRVSGDGRFVSYRSDASNLVVNDTNSSSDIFVHEIQTATTVLASVAFSGGSSNERSHSPSLSMDGRYVVFDSFASNLVVGDANGSMADVFVRDLLLGTTTLVSLASTGGQGNAWCQGASISDDGRYVAFSSMASNLVAGDANAAIDVFVRDRLLGATLLASRATSGLSGNGESTEAQISADGRFVAFRSLASDLIPGDTNAAGDIFLFEIATGTTLRASLTAAGAQSVGGSFLPSISADGSRVAFVGGDADFVLGDTNGFVDVFLRDRVAGTTELVSRSTSGAFGTDFSTYPSISGNGRFVGFESPVDNFVEPMAPASRNVFVRDTLGSSPTAAPFCVAGTTTNGCQAAVTAAGVASASASSGFTITVSSVEGQSVGLIFYGTSGPLASPFGGGSSVLCLRGALQRTMVQPAGGTAGACDGQLALDWNQFVSVQPGVLGTPYFGGETVWIQGWFRDPLAPLASNLSNALWFEVGH